MNEVSRRGFLLGSAKAAVGAGLAVSGMPLLSACSSPTTASKPSQLDYQFLGNPNETDAGVVSNALNSLLSAHGKKFTVSLQAVQNYDQAMALKASSGQLGSTFFTAPWANDYYKLASNKSLLALDDLLPAHAPSLWKSMPASTWDAVRVKGKIYGIINQQRFPKLWGFVTQSSLAAKFGFDSSAIGTFEELEPYLAKIKQAGGGITPWATDNQGNNAVFYPEVYGWDPVAGSYGLAVRYDDPDLKVFNMFDTDEFRAAAAVMRRWHEAGYTVSSPLSAADASAQNSSGKVGVIAGQQGPSNPQYFPFKTEGKCLVRQPILNTDGVAATLNGINAKLTNPENALEFFELLNTDKDFYNTLCFGVKGTHWVFTDEAAGVVGFPKGTSAANSKWNPNTDWMFGNQFNAYYRDSYDAKQKRWQAEAAVNKSAVTSKAIGFAMDISPVKTQVATISAAIGQYRPQVVNGLADPGKSVSNLLKRMDGAGMNKLMAEAQSQLDAFRNSR
ncbi:DUF3502 domain-containing protein [Kribbella sp. NPDC004536]|uniref:ABC transporter substrate-binding protein n=1 Tax=Kribbella sp. NPDC004536 TaxID=3364106 RepID=UPI00369F4143